jgi:hypothetical protein
MVVSRPTLSHVGEDRRNSVEPSAALASEFTSHHVMMEQFPMLVRHGIPDVDLTIHSHFLSYLAALAQPLGYSGIVECPLLVNPDSRWAALGEVRPDVIWFDRVDNVPLVAFEFERFDRGTASKLRTKVENLNIAYLRSEKRLQLAVLIYWVRSGVAPKAIREVTRGYWNGFVRRGVRVPAAGCPLHIFKCAWRSVPGGLVVSDILPVEVI